MRLRIQSVFIVFFFYALAAVVAQATAQTPPLDYTRQGYSAAVEAIDRGSWTQYKQLRPSLDDYPLAIYLDFFQLSRQAATVRPADARQFMQDSADSPLPNRFLSAYLFRAGKDRRWDDFLQLMPQEPATVELKCYFYRAKLATGERDAAWAGAEKLWVYGKSRPDECDPLFDAWMKAGAVTDEMVWARLVKAFEARQRSLMKYVARQGSAELAPWAARLQAVYQRPERMRQQTLPADDPRSADVASLGVTYLARYNPELALAFWRDYQAEIAFTPEQVKGVERAIALQSLFAKTEAHRDWLDQALPGLADDKLTGIRLRWALEEQDWQTLLDTLPLLSASEQADGAWRYWKAIALQNSGGDAVAARELLQNLAKERSYYSFLAADKVGVKYAFNHQPLVLEAAATEPLAKLPALLRIDELNFHREENLAHSEWSKVLRDAAQPEQQQQLAQVASQRGWYRMAIDAANQAKAWDLLDLRFPTPYTQTFERYAALQKVPSTELMAIARRESAFFAGARSPVGARGLMQIMPATGRQVASSLGESHSRSDLYEIDHNVLLGSAYYRQLLDRFGGNRVFALTAYNAGPHRVDRWRNKSGEEVSAEIWIETIPYHETRNYVQAVLAYNVVFQYLMGDTAPLLSPAERSAAY